ncbi:MAG: hypothetical protein HY907_18040 [Deltaproteobacteria bacterium]|nr:hypothetical protein [Deltaproteobacteria bacterium]
MRTIEDRLAEGKDVIAERIAYQISAFHPCGATTMGPSAIAAQVSAVVSGFVEALQSRQIAPFVTAVQELLGAEQAAERLACAEIHTVLDLLEDLALASVAETGGRPTVQASTVIRTLIAQGRESVPRETKCED